MKSLDNGSRTKGLYSEYRFGDFCYGLQRERHNRPLVEFLRALDAQGAVFDIGCGTGYWIEAALRLGVDRERLHGVDIAAGNAADLRAKGFHAVCGDVLSLPLKDDTAGVTISNGVIHATGDPQGAFLELVRITKPGGLIFLAVYNKWNPYFYVVHRATAPLRYVYWNWTKRVMDIIYPAAEVLFQPLSYLFMGRFLDRRTGMVMLADQVIVPYAHLFSKGALRRYAEQCGCTVLSWGYADARTMVTVVFRVDKPRPGQ